MEQKQLCTPEEIAAKRRRAKELQERRKEEPSPKSSSSTSLPSASSYTPIQSKYFSTKRKLSPAADEAPGNEFSHRSLKHSATFPPAPNSIQKIEQTLNKPRIAGFASVQFVLIAIQRVQVRMNKFIEPVVEIMRTIPSKKYDPATTHWDFAMHDYSLLYSRLLVLKELTIVKLPSWIFALKRYTLETNAFYDFSVIDAELRNTLMPFQEESLCFAINRNGRCLIADEMGLGKTIQALAISAYYREDWPILVISTASTCASWESTIVKYLPSVPIMDIQLISKQKGALSSRAKVTIVSYDMMNRRIEQLHKQRFGICIFDESHLLKNFKTKLFKCAEMLAITARRVILLTGTPALSKPCELYTQLKLIDPGFFPFRDFSIRYCDGKDSTFGWDASGQSNLEELEIVLRHKFMIRRTKDNLSALQLPPKIQEIIQLDLSLSELSEEKRRSFEELQQTDFNKSIKNDREILPYFHKMGQIKLPAICAYVEQLLKVEKRKFIIFAHHSNVLDGIEQVLKHWDKEYIRIDGRTLERQKKVDSFQRQERVQCALLSITATYAGITLTSAQLVIFAELNWTPSILAQAEARAHRIGQRHPVTIRYLIAPKTLDDYLWNMLQRKQRTLANLKLTTDSFRDFQVKASTLGTTASTSTFSTTPANTIRSYFQPDRKSETVTSTTPSAENGNKENTPSLTNTATARDDSDEIDEGFDAFFNNFNTQMLGEEIGGNGMTVVYRRERPAVSEDPLDDGMDGLFEAIPLDMPEI